MLSESDVQRATSVLCAQDYKLETPLLEDGSPAIPDLYEFHFEGARDGMVAELRWRLELLHPKFRRHLWMAWVWERSESVMLAGKEVPALDPVSNLLVLCMHGTKHRWSRLIWIYDVARFLTVHPNLDLGGAPPGPLADLWAMGVLLAHRECAASAPEECIRRFASDRAANDSAMALEATLFLNPGSIPMSRIPYSLRVLDDRDRIRWLFTLEFLRPRNAISTWYVCLDCCRRSIFWCARSACSWIGRPDKNRSLGNMAFDPLSLRRGHKVQIVKGFALRREETTHS